MGKMVKCIDDTGSAHGVLTIGKEYEVTKDTGTTYYLNGVGGDWLKNRFVDAVAANWIGKQVKCVNADGCISGEIVVDKVYTVTAYFSVQDTFALSGCQASWRRNRFVEVDAKSRKFVRCTNNQERDDLFVGVVYEVMKDQENIYTLDGICDTANANRFVDVNPSSKLVRCMDNSGAASELKHNQLYEYNGQRKNSTGAVEIFLAGIGGSFRQSRFEELAIILSPAVQQSTTTVIPPKGVDHEEERIWAMWKAPQKDHCPCGILKKNCGYHR